MIPMAIFGLKFSFHLLKTKAIEYIELNLNYKMLNEGYE
jgi:hypothetical protein